MAHMCALVWLDEQPRIDGNAPQSGLGRFQIGEELLGIAKCAQSMMSCSFSQAKF
jgi:hypothetical protein